MSTDQTRQEKCCPHTFDLENHFQLLKNEVFKSPKRNQTYSLKMIYQKLD